MDNSLEPLALSIHEACAIARAGRTSIYEAIRPAPSVHRNGNHGGYTAKMVAARGWLRKA
jgi:hypothetical protein